jgi:hypothetical protein
MHRSGEPCWVCVRCAWEYGIRRGGPLSFKEVGAGVMVVILCFSHICMQVQVDGVMH